VSLRRQRWPAGALAGLEYIDVTRNAAGALTAINTILDALSMPTLSSVPSRDASTIRIDFVSSLGDKSKSGYSTLTDGQTSKKHQARLQALQVQQQLGVSRLYRLPNQAPQALVGPVPIGTAALSL